MGADLVSEAQGRLDLVEDRFSNLESVLAGGDAAAVDGVVFDLGVSSMQLDQAARGFSFRLDGPLDMRMGRDGPSAADVIAAASERELAAIIATLGEEHQARAIARAIVKARDEQPIGSTRALADIVARVVRTREGMIHPATRTFQALRIFVNDELAELARGLAAAERVLKPAGRLVVVAFHSLEDRIVKNFLVERSRAPAASRHRPQIASAPADVPRAHAPAGNPGRSRDCGQPARPLGQAARRRAHRCRAAFRRHRRAAAAAALARLGHAGAGMILRIVNFVVIGALVLAAAYVYRIKFDSTVQAERLAKLRSEVRRERDRIAALRAQWGELDNPARIEALAKRYLQAQAGGADAVRCARSAARSSAAIHQARQQRSDRRHDREYRRTRLDDRQHRAAGRECQRSAGADARGRSGSVNRMTVLAQTVSLDPGAALAAAARAQPALRRTSTAPPRRGRGWAWRSSPSPPSTPSSPRVSSCSRWWPTAASPITAAPAMRSRPRVPISSTATARSWRPMCACRRSTASRGGSSMSTKRSSS